MIGSTARARYDTGAAPYGPNPTCWMQTEGGVSITGIITFQSISVWGALGSWTGEYILQYTVGPAVHGAQAGNHAGTVRAVLAGQPGRFAFSLATPKRVTEQFSLKVSTVHTHLLEFYGDGFEGAITDVRLFPVDGFENDPASNQTNPHSHGSTYGTAMPVKIELMESYES